MRKRLKKIHNSWLIAWFCTAFLVGVALSVYVPRFGLVYVLIPVVVSLITAAIFRTKPAIIFVILGGVLFGLFRGGLGQVASQEFVPYINQGEVIVRGVVSEDSALTAQGNQQLKLKDVVIDGHHLSGTVWVSTSSTTKINRSDLIVVRGSLQKGFGSFQASMYRADLVEVRHIDNSDVPREMRDSFAENVRKVISEPQASLGLGYLVGQRTALPEDMINNLKILGLTHIVVASGYNLTILVRFARRLFAGVSKYLSLISGLLLTAGFVSVTGFSPSMSRAALITTLCLLAWYFGRAIHPFVLLSFSAAVTVFINPAYVWGDLGWYLSFAAFGGVIVLSPLIINYFWGNKRPNSLVQILVETSSAQLLTAPIIAFAFGQYAPLALLSNVLILPLVPLAMASTFVAGLGAIMFSGGFASIIIAKPAQIILSYMTAVVNKLALFPVATAEVCFGLTALVASYLTAIVLVVFLMRRTRHDFLEDNIIL